MDKQPRKKYDWALMRHQYVTSLEGTQEVTLESLRARYGCSKRHIKRVSGKEGWAELRASWRAEAAAKARADAAETAGQRLNRHAKIMQMIQAKGVKAIQENAEAPKPRDLIEAVKMERALYGETEGHVEVEITDHDKRMARAYCKAYREVKEQERADLRKAGLPEKEWMKE